VPRPRPRRALRPSATVRVARVAVPLALVGLATSGIVAFAEPSSEAQTAVPPVPAAAASAPGVDAVVREQPVSRDVIRTASPAPVPTAAPTATPTPSPAPTKRAPATKPAKRAAPTAEDLAAHAKASRTMWATDDLNIRTNPERDSKVVTEVDPGTRLAATGTVRDGFRLVVFKGKGRWVSAKYVSKKKPDPAKTGGVTDAACGKGSAMESGLTPDAVLVHRTVCARFPQVSSFGGTRGGGGFHATGQAVDCMISDSTVGWQLARWVRAHARELGVSEVIYSQHIWTVQRSGEGWRSMSDRGSATANHDDHVHVSVYGHKAA
jgi:hypothetical protein